MVLILMFESLFFSFLFNINKKKKKNKDSNITIRFKRSLRDKYLLRGSLLLSIVKFLTQGHSLEVRVQILTWEKHVHTD